MMLSNKYYRALLDRDDSSPVKHYSQEVLLKNIVLSKEFFEKHAHYLQNHTFADEDVLIHRIELHKKKVTIGVNYIKDLIEMHGDEFVREAYRLFLDREPDIEGLQNYRNILQQSGKGVVIRGIINSEEALARSQDIIILSETYRFISEIE